MRPRSHQLEHESRLAFEAALPSAWVPRTVTPDYGIDTTVEVFAEDGRSTGRSFHVQLKATDEPGLAKALRGVRFSVEKVDYYRSLPVPLLVVLYHAPSRILYARWFHAHDPHVSATTPVSGTPPASMGFRFDPSDAWTLETPRRLDEGLRGFLMFRSAALNLPLALAVEGTDGVTDSVPVTFALRRVLAPVSALVTVEHRAPSAEEPSVRLSPSASRVSLADVASVTLDHDPGIQRSSVDALAADLALGLATALARVGQANLAAQITLVAAPHALTITDLDVCFTLAAAMFQAQRIREAVELADQLDGSDQEEMQLAASAFLTALLFARKLSPGDRALAVAAAERRIERREARSELARAGTEAYNLGMLHKRGGEGDAAVSAFERAVTLEPRYDDRTYFLEDLAGALFETGRYDDAVLAYGRALELGAGGMIPALYADALLCAGLYGDAATWLDRYLVTEDGVPGAEWRLKKRVLPLIRERGGERQVRQTVEAQRLAESVDLTTNLPIVEAQRRLDQALAADSCCAEAWFRRFFVEVAIHNSLGPGSDMALAGAVLHRNSPGAWVNAAIAAEASGASDTELMDILHTAYRFNPDDFPAELMADRDPGEHSRLLGLLEAVAVAWDGHQRRAGFVMRFNSDDGEAWETVVGEPS